QISSNVTCGRGVGVFLAGATGNRSLCWWVAPPMEPRGVRVRRRSLQQRLVAATSIALGSGLFRGLAGPQAFGVSAAGRWRMTDGTLLAGSEVTSSSASSRAAGPLLRAAASSIPLDELAPDELAARLGSAPVPAFQIPGVNDASVPGTPGNPDMVFPKLPDGLDSVVQVILIVFPIIVLVSWVSLNVASYQESQKAKLADQKRKIEKAIKTDPTWDGTPDDPSWSKEKMEAPKKKKSKKLTALEEAILMEKGPTSPYF
ncbi:unnamed protein product, partial [Polarella glacialis]